MTRRVILDEMVTLAAAKFLDDPHGFAALLDAIDTLADNPEPVGSLPYGPTVRRWDVPHTTYRVTYSITELDGEPVVIVGYIARIL